MNSGQMVFSQLMDCLPWWRFHPIVKQYQGNHKVKHFSCAEHFRVMAFAQLTHRKSLRDVEVAFNAIVAEKHITWASNPKFLKARLLMQMNREIGEFMQTSLRY